MAISADARTSQMYRARHPARVTASLKKYDEDHRRERAEYQRKYRELHGAELSLMRKFQRRIRPALGMLKHAKRNAKEKNVPFDLREEDIPVSSYCLVLGMPLKVGDGRRTDASPSLDRIVPERGYVRGNVRVISWRANNLKSNATIEELRAVLQYMERETCVD